MPNFSVEIKGKDGSRLWCTITSDSAEGALKSAESLCLQGEKGDKATGSVKNSKGEMILEAIQKT